MIRKETDGRYSAVGSWKVIRSNIKSRKEYREFFVKKVKKHKKYREFYVGSCKKWLGQI